MKWVKAVRFKCHVEEQNDPNPDKVIEMRHRRDGVMYYQVCNAKSLELIPDRMESLFNFFLAEETKVEPVSDEVFKAECARQMQLWNGEFLYLKTEEELNEMQVPVPGESSCRG